jgi:hypothetical protein
MLKAAIFQPEAEYFLFAALSEANKIKYNLCALCVSAVSVYFLALFV